MACQPWDRARGGRTRLGRALQAWLLSGRAPANAPAGPDGAGSGAAAAGLRPIECGRGSRQRTSLDVLPIPAYAWE
eukprot:CAMPEP_0197891314 /NCGR_PEP_ID=MMETSP1439-20131203/28051_1 /TAXON_ID=66791 /ORGANISM="Gonyaulax spinifera, Strain CCMP409" /LENGTH=75 /DNA_ID=CAMNT_0043511407 /DNA_START=35 /DNA_END=263 /DNA_ORIENTATION=-